MKAFQFERRGRKRKPRQELELVSDPRVIAQAMPHRRAVTRELRHDARAENQLGVLALNGAITDNQYRAGVLLRECVQRFHAVMGVPRHNRGSVPLDGARRSGREMSEAWARQCKERHKQVYEALIDKLGIRGAQLVTHLVVYDEKPQRDALNLLRKGLEILVSFYRLTQRRA